MNRSRVRPLKPIRFRTSPLTTHALSWSPDADLAIATNDTIYILFPEYPQGHKDGRDGSIDQFSLRLELAGLFHPYPTVNTQLCAFAGITVPPPDDESESEYEEVEVPDKRHITGRGGSFSQVVRVEWSPPGLGVNLRPIIMAMTTSGELIAFGEHKDPKFTITSGKSARNTRMWKTLWGLGASMPIPHEDEEGSYRTMDERILSFSWSKYIATGKALLAYKTDEAEVVVMSVQHYQKPGSSGELAEEYIWQVRELMRFEAPGPHEPVDEMGGDYIPSGSSFALRWSPCVTVGDSKICYLGYIVPNYVGFRKFTISGQWEAGEEPIFEVDEVDSVGICLNLGMDAFLEWEDFVWKEGNSIFARGIICSPFAISPFQVDVLASPNAPTATHSTSDCNTTYPNHTSTNPITDIIIYSPDPTTKPLTPLFSLVRSSLTASSTDWFETNVPQTPSSSTPSWVSNVHQITRRLIPRSEAIEVPDVDSNGEDTDDEMVDAEATGLKVHPYRFRFWGLAASPGGGSTAALVSKHNTQYPTRAARCRIIFDEVTEHDTSVPSSQSKRGLSTEGKMWEWMYARGPDVPGATTQDENEDPGLSTPLKDFFKDLKLKQTCWLCDSGLQDVDNEARCLNGHSVAKCSSSGLAILAPGISRVCAVCQRRCLRESELRKFAEEHAEGSSLPPMTEACGSCGGKFVA